MCGICGVYDKGGARVPEALLRSMCALMIHRGPDGEGVYSRGSLGMGMRRLAIIDLKTGDQPVYNEDLSVAVMLNGEIYNYVELKRGLEERGHRFSTSSDTEVIAHLFEEHGEGAFGLLNGFFAIALHDSRKDEFYLVRDRWGIKPVYYTQAGGFAFSSEIKVLQALGRRFTLDTAALWDYFSYGYFPAEDTMLKEVKLLKPASLLKLSPGSRAERRQYWALKKDPAYGRLGLAEASELFSAKVEHAVKISLRSDVPVGIFLSGGLDSNILLYEARKHLTGKILSYTVGFDSGHFDEGALVRRLAGDYDLDATFLTMTPAWVRDNFKKAAAYHHSLAVTPAFMALQLLSAEAAKRLKVVITGVAGDELMLGYPTYQADKLWRLFNPLPGGVKRGLAGLAGALPNFPGRIALDYKLKKFAQGVAYDREKAHYSWRTIFTEEEKERLFTPALADASRHDSFAAYEAAFAETEKEWSFLSRASAADIKVWMCNMGHDQCDTFTMSNSLEMRPPLLENGLAEFLFSLPDSLKLRGLTSKRLFRSHYRGKLPDYILDQGKMGFHLPMAPWFKGELKDFAAGYLFGGAAKDYFDPGTLRAVFDGHMNGSDDNAFKLFSIICFLEWVEQHKGML